MYISIRPDTDTRIVPQSKPLTSNMRPNNNNGYSYVVDDIIVLHRYICMGTVGGNYYLTGSELMRQCDQVTLRLVLASM